MADKKSNLSEIIGGAFIIILILYWAVVDPNTAPSILEPYKNIILILGCFALLGYSLFQWLKDDDIDTPLGRLAKIVWRIFIVVMVVVATYLAYLRP